jgi:trehalose transport system substrate-binding protein
VTGITRFRSVLGLVTVVIATTACGADTARFGGGPLAGTTITFAISVPDEERPAIQKLLTRFEDRSKVDVDLHLLSRFRDQPPSRINLVTSLDAGGLLARLAAEVPDQPSIHLFAQDNLALLPLVEGGLVEDLSHVAVPPAVLPSMMPPRFGDRQYFLPFRPNIRLTYLDADIAADAGVAGVRTSEELVAAAEKLKAAHGRPAVTLSLAEGDPAAVTVSEWIVAHGGDPLVLNDAGSVAAFETLQTLWRRDLLARESLFARFDTEVENLRSGRAALAQNWSFTSAVLEDEGVLGRFHVLPGWRGPVRAAHVIGGDVLGVPRGVTGRQREAAVALAEYLMSREAQELLARENAWPSIRSDAYQTVAPGLRQTFDAIDQALRDGWFRPNVAHWPEVTDLLNEAVDRVVVRLEPVRPTLDELAARAAAAAAAKGGSGS